MSWCLILEQITESVEELIQRANLRNSDLTVLSRITNENRKQEWLKSKVIVWENFNRHVDYLENGAPVIDNGFISISHSMGQVAVLFSEEERCGIDIEFCERDVIRTAHKFANEQEIKVVRKFFPQNPALLIWCAKEALYKYSGIDGAEFLTDFKIISTVCDSLLCEAFGKAIEVSVEFRDNLIVCYCCK